MIGDDEHRLASVEADLDGGAGKLGADLRRRLGERLHECQPHRGVERCGEPLGGGANVRAPDLSGPGEV
jgi:hypothetical protein